MKPAPTTKDKKQVNPTLRRWMQVTATYHKQGAHICVEMNIYSSNMLR